MSGDGILERHGMRCTNSKGNTSSVTIGESNGGLIWMAASFDEQHMTMREARYLASKLYRLARRLREREAFKEDAA